MSLNPRKHLEEAAYLWRDDNRPGAVVEYIDIKYRGCKKKERLLISSSAPAPLPNGSSAEHDELARDILENLLEANQPLKIATVARRMELWPGSHFRNVMAQLIDEKEVEKLPDGRVKLPD